MLAIHSLFCRTSSRSKRPARDTPTTSLPPTNSEPPHRTPQASAQATGRSVLYAYPPSPGLFCVPTSTHTPVRPPHDIRSTNDSTRNSTAPTPLAPTDTPKRSSKMFASLRRLFGHSAKDKELKRQKEEEEARERVVAFLLENPEVRGLGPVVAGSLGGAGGSVGGVREGRRWKIRGEGGEVAGYAVPGWKSGWGEQERGRKPQEDPLTSNTPPLSLTSNIPPMTTPTPASGPTLSTYKVSNEHIFKIALASAESARRNPPRPALPNPFTTHQPQIPLAPPVQPSTTPPTTPPANSPTPTLDPPYSRRETLLQQALVERQRMSARVWEAIKAREVERLKRLREKCKAAGWGYPGMGPLRSANSGVGLPVQYEGMELWEEKSQEWMEEGALDKDGMYGDLWKMRQRFARMSTTINSTPKYIKDTPRSPEHSATSSPFSTSSIPTVGPFTPHRPTATNARIREYNRNTAPKISRQTRPEPDVTVFPNPKRAKVVKSVLVITNTTTPGPDFTSSAVATQPPTLEWRESLEKLGREAVAELQAHEAKEAYELEVVKRWMRRSRL